MPAIPDSNLVSVLSKKPGTGSCLRGDHPTLGLHSLQSPRPAASTVRVSYTLAVVRSKRRLPSARSGCPLCQYDMLHLAPRNQ